jgi:hypothetical protein
MPRPLKQKEMVLSHLHSINEDGERRGITAIEALALYRVMRLAPRIEELKKDGYNIESRAKRDNTGKRYVRYFLDGTKRR